MSERHRIIKPHNSQNLLTLKDFYQKELRALEMVL